MSGVSQEAEFVWCHSLSINNTMMTMILPWWQFLISDHKDYGRGAGWVIFSLFERSWRDWISRSCKMPGWWKFMQDWGIFVMPKNVKSFSTVITTISRHPKLFLLLTWTAWQENGSCFVTSTHRHITTHSSWFGGVLSLKLKNWVIEELVEYVLCQMMVKVPARLGNFRQKECQTPPWRIFRNLFLQFLTSIYF